MTQKRKWILPALVVVAATAACVIYYYAARILCLPYVDKSTIKMSLFFGLPLAAWLVEAEFRPRAYLQKLFQLVRVTRPTLLRQIWIVVGGLLLIVLCNFLIEPLSRLFGVASILDEIRSRTSGRPLQIARLMFYIPVVNAFGEELFFRGLCYQTLYQLGLPRLAHFFSAGLFALYHLAIFQTWFSLPLLVFCLINLFIAGLLLNSLVRRDGHIIGAWLVHALFNVATLTMVPHFLN
ncbi:MAG: type II CAAX endopeptidase family protein [Bacillota bacterium]|nr:type II CAAX endopeptidase family protein [Bacillota bacterium]